MVAKGILTGADARRAVEAGVAGVVVSNHGGRQLDGDPATLDVLPEVVDEVGGDIEVLLDGGVRTGPDVRQGGRARRPGGARGPAGAVGPGRRGRGRGRAGAVACCATRSPTRLRQAGVPRSPTSGPTWCAPPPEADPGPIFAVSRLSQADRHRLIVTGWPIRWWSRRRS